MWRDTGFNTHVLDLAGLTCSVYWSQGAYRCRFLGLDVKGSYKTLDEAKRAVEIFANHKLTAALAALEARTVQAAITTAMPRCLSQG